MVKEIGWRLAFPGSYRREIALGCCVHWKVELDLEINEGPVFRRAGVAPPSAPLP
jgi:hypothetical protein